MIQLIDPEFDAAKPRETRVPGFAWVDGLDVLSVPLTAREPLPRDPWDTHDAAQWEGL